VQNWQNKITEMYDKIKKNNVTEECGLEKFVIGVRYRKKYIYDLKNMQSNFSLMAHVNYKLRDFNI